nr:thiamine-phosphate kinase [Bacillota bacterium]
MLGKVKSRNESGGCALDEFALIRRLLEAAPAMQKAGTAKADVTGESLPAVIVGPGDDGAVVRPRPGKDWVITCDAMVEGPHFTRQTMTPHAIGWKVMAANLSDVAAMAAEPRYALVTLGVNEDWTVDELAALFTGMWELASRFDVRIIGGDTVRSPGGLMLSVTLLGDVAPDRAWLRSGAKPGDWVFVTGPLGGSAAGLYALLHPETAVAWEQQADGGKRDVLIRLHQYPEPQVEAGRLLSTLPVCGALNDVSDGLASEAWELAEASRVKICLEADRIPIADAVRDFARFCGKDPVQWALSGGEDFQLVGTVPPDAWPALADAFAQQGRTVYRCGWVSEGVGVVLRQPDGREEPLAKSGYNHFAKTDGKE